MHLPSVLPLGALLLREPAPDCGPKTRHVAPRDVPFGGIVTHCTTPGVVALTFDDGPFTYTAQILDELDAVGAKATFFINGDNWSEGIDDESKPWPAMLRRMVATGHQIGSHTWSHLDMTKADSETRYFQMRELEKALERVVGKSPTYFRPPYASCEGQCLTDVENMGYHIINFDVDTKDYENNTPNTVHVSEEKFSASVDGGQPKDSFLVLGHDVHEQTAVALTPFMLQKIKDHGYRAVTVGECLGDPEENWYRSQ